MRNHDPIVDTEPLIRPVDLAISIPCHDAHHLLQPDITPHSTDDQDL